MNEFPPVQALAVSAGAIVVPSFPHELTGLSTFAFPDQEQLGLQQSKYRVDFPCITGPIDLTLKSLPELGGGLAAAGEATDEVEVNVSDDEFEAGALIAFAIGVLTEFEVVVVHLIDEDCAL